jgi:hypothetical protein
MNIKDIGNDLFKKKKKDIGNDRKYNTVSYLLLYSKPKKKKKGYHKYDKNKFKRTIILCLPQSPLI